MDWGSIAATVSTIGGGIYTFFNTFKFINEGEMGIKLRFGKAVRYRFGSKKGQPKECHPGFILLIPYVDKLSRRPVRIQTIELNQQTITLESGLSYAIDAVVRFRVTKVYNALFMVDNLTTVMRNVAMSELRNVLTEYKNAKDMTKTGEMSDQLTKALKGHEEAWGVEVEHFSVISCVPTPESQQIVNAAAGANIRLEGLAAAFTSYGRAKEDVFRFPQLAAALIGIPVATMVSQPIEYESRPQEPTRDPAVKKGFFEQLGEDVDDEFKPPPMT
jgi:regulator of protease activity HflC (stomatin/prohibitin superfamily)